MNLLFGVKHREDRYLVMTAAITQVPVPTALNYLCTINLRVIHNKDYSVVNIKESQNYFLIVAVLFLLISV